jgi:ubiquinone/menaquinone biosynthesis C-methylase UbiE
MKRNARTGSDFYRLAGIDDVGSFYRERFYSGGVFDARYFDSIYRYDINYARTMWIYDNVRAGASLLDLGCGEGVLGLLKRKNIHLGGIDLSSELLTAAKRNGYDTVACAELTDLPFAAHSFDYVVTLDVMGHVADSEKNAVLAETKRVLRPGGVTMHGVEVFNPDLHQHYESMSEEELASFISIDGHIGLEEDEAVAARFRSFFSNVQTEPRYSLCLSAAEIVKQYDHYGAPFDADFIQYLRGLSFSERKAFDMAMGYVFGKISELQIRLPRSGLYLLVKASDAPLESFYNAHRDRKDLFIATNESDGPVYLDRCSRAFFDNGWYAANDLPPIARWMRDCSRIRFSVTSLSQIRLQLTTHIPELNSKPMTLEMRVNGVLLSHFCLFAYGSQEVEIAIPESLREKREYELEIRCDRTWQPSISNSKSNDDRHLSIAVWSIEIVP